MEDNEKEFIAYSRKLLRVLKQIKEAIEAKNNELATNLLSELIEDTQHDIEA